MIDIRVIYQKLERVKYISHLDMNRLMQRALARSKLPVWFTQGFNPHLYLTFALPLSLGFESEYEIVDIRLNEPVPCEEITARLNAQMPDGVRVLSSAPPQFSINDIAWSVYEVQSPGTVEDWNSLMNDSIFIQKKTKRGVKDLDIRPFIALDNGGFQENFPGVRFTLRCASGIEHNVNPSLAVAAFCDRFGGDAADANYRRTAILTANGDIFR